jgi:hypothetical protein
VLQVLARGREREREITRVSARMVWALQRNTQRKASRKATLIHYGTRKIGHRYVVALCSCGYANRTHTQSIELKQQLRKATRELGQNIKHTINNTIVRGNQPASEANEGGPPEVAFVLPFVEATVLAARVCCCCCCTTAAAAAAALC